jgi:hypothetical protein
VGASPVRAIGGNEDEKRSTEADMSFDGSNGRMICWRYTICNAFIGQLLCNLSVYFPGSRGKKSKCDDMCDVCFSGDWEI